MTDQPADPAVANTASTAKPAPPAGGNRGRFADALKDPGLRRFTAGTLAWGTAHQMITASQGFVLLELTDDRIWLAWLGAAVGVPNIIAAIIGGVLSDRIQRRTLLILGSSIVAMPMLAIAVLYVTDSLEPWHILVAGSAQGVSLALDWVSRLSLLPVMVSRRIMVSALSIDQASFNAARVFGPLIAAGILASAGVSASYFVITGLFALAIVIYTTFKRQPRDENGGHKEKIGFGSAFHEIKEAAATLRTDSILSLNVLFTAMNAMMLGGFVFMIAAFVKEEFDAGEIALGVVFATTGTGAFIGALIVAYRGGTTSAGRGLLVSNLLFAGSAALYAIAGNTAVAATIAFFFGLFNAYHIALGIAAIQTNVPDNVRGRVTGAYELAWASFPLGGLIVGSLAELVSLRGAIALAAGFVATLTIMVFVLSSRMRHLSLHPKEGE